MTWREFWIVYGGLAAIIVGFFVVTFLVLAVTGNLNERGDPKPEVFDPKKDYSVPYERGVVPTPPALPPYHAPDPVVTVPSAKPPVLDPSPERPERRPFIQLEPRDWQKGGSR